MDDLNGTKIIVRQTYVMQKKQTCTPLCSIEQELIALEARSFAHIQLIELDGNGDAV